MSVNRRPKCQSTGYVNVDIPVKYYAAIKNNEENLKVLMWNAFQDIVLYEEESQQQSRECSLPTSEFKRSV